MCTSLTGEDGLEVRDDWPEPGPCAPAQVRIAMHAVSVNFPDTLITRGLYQQHLDPPFVVGNEGAGVVTEVGSEVTGLSVGDRVLTLTGSGAFAEFVLATPPPQQVHRIPDEMPFDHAAAFDLTYGTAAHGLAQRGSVQPGETVLVTGAVAVAARRRCRSRRLGARVIAVAGGPVKTALVRELGADDVVDHHELGSDERALSTACRELTGGRGVDVVFDNVGAPDSSDDVRELVRCLAWNGRYLVVGFAGGGIPGSR